MPRGSWLRTGADLAVGDNGSMRKRIAGRSNPEPSGQSAEGWLNLDQIATVEVTSQHPSFPIESVFTSSHGPGWRASQEGEQRIWIIFDEPVSVRRSQLRFHDAESERTQEFSLRWSPANGGRNVEVLRQRWNFSPTGSTTEFVDYAVQIEGVSVLDLAIDPDISGHNAFATLAEWRVG
jgi:hypothetical protein